MAKSTTKKPSRKKPTTRDRRPLVADPKDGQPEVSKLGVAVSRRIESDIVESGWPIGEVLGSEPEMIERYGVSRAVFREAMRIVEHHGVAQMRRGPGGGLVVTAPHAASATRAMALTLNYQHATVQDVIATRKTLELASVQRAAERIDADGIERLRAAVAEEQSQAERSAEEDRPIPGTHDLHLLIADLSGNPVLRMFIEVLTRLTAEMMPQEEVRKADLSDTAAEVAHVHSMIADAIIAGDGAVAAHLMNQHLRAMGGWLR
jgi:DNA-binding FadR family transcriptional regulator